MQPSVSPDSGGRLGQPPIVVEQDHRAEEMLRCPIGLHDITLGDEANARADDGCARTGLRLHQRFDAAILNIDIVIEHQRVGCLRGG